MCAETDYQTTILGFYASNICISFYLHVELNRVILVIEIYFDQG